MTKRFAPGDQVHVSVPASETYHTNAVELDAFVVRADYAINGRCTGVVVVPVEGPMNEDAHLYVSPARYVTLR